MGNRLGKRNKVELSIIEGKGYIDQNMRVLTTNIVEDIYLKDISHNRLLYEILIMDKLTAKSNSYSFYRNQKSLEYCYRKIAQSVLITFLERKRWFIRIIKPTDRFDRCYLYDYYVRHIHLHLCEYDPTQIYCNLSRIYLIAYDNKHEYYNDNRYLSTDVIYETK